FGGLARTTVLLGIARATDLALTGATLDADAAAAIGLVTRTTTPGGALSAALELVQELRRSSPVARTQTLLATRALHHKLAAELFDAESQGAARTWIAGEWHQALLARRDGREPTW
ncbi:MAG: hypothetical protein ABMB14_24915, partial [Myxococcota bacterium]